MKAVRFQCSRCGGGMVLCRHLGVSGLSCPFCGNIELLEESDAVQLAQLHAASELAGMEYRAREHRAILDLERSRRKAQAAAICVFTLIALVLIIIYLS